MTFRMYSTMRIFPRKRKKTEIPVQVQCLHLFIYETDEGETEMKGIPAKHDSQRLIDLGGGTTRRILAYNDDLMSVEVSFETGAEGAVHTHPHTQLSYVLSGRFDYTVEGETVTLEPSDSIVVPSGLPHGTVCLEKGVLLDVFNPKRDDFLK